MTETELETRLRGYAGQYDRDFPSTTGVERRIMARIAITPARPGRPATRKWEWGMAGGLVREVAIVSALLLLASLLSLQTRTVTPPVTATPPVAKPVQPPAYWTALHFVSPDVGWIAATKASTGPETPGPTFVYKTADGGRTWHQQLTWDGPGPEQVRFSADGSEGLVVGRGGVPIFRTADGGAHWQRTGLPPQVSAADSQYFLNANEGWVMAYLNQVTAGIAGVFHTTDGGQHWTQTARLDVSQEFSHGNNGGSLQGSLVFSDSSTGWMTPANYSGTGITPVPPFLYVTHDGGSTWAVQPLAVPSGGTLNSTTSIIAPPEFFANRQGVALAAEQSLPTGLGAPTIEGTYAYTTSDGGDHWSAPYQVVLPGGIYFQQTFTMIDPKNWLSFGTLQVQRTTDGGVHWEVLAGELPGGGHASVVDFLDASSGWAAGYVGTSKPNLAIYRTTDGGAHWSAVSAPDAGAA